MNKVKNCLNAHINNFIAKKKTTKVSFQTQKDKFTKTFVYQIKRPLCLMVVFIEGSFYQRLVASHINSGLKYSKF